ncbi:toprim domain-containing protein, partial [Alistipes ihumii]
RGIDPAIARTYCREVRYTIGGKEYFAIGFRNDAGGWELRNPRFKGSSTPKNITTLDNGSDTTMVFEGFIDFLSYLSLKANPTPAIDATVLNSVTNLQKAVPFLSHHRVVHAFLDNDDAGRKALARLEESLPSTEVIDQSVFYRNHKDLNDYWREKRNLATPQTPPHERQRKETERAHLTVPQAQQCVSPPVKKRGPGRKF